MCPLRRFNSLERHYTNVRVIESTFEEFEPENGDLVVVNIAEYFMTKSQMLRFIEKGGKLYLITPTYTTRVFPNLLEHS